MLDNRHHPCPCCGVIASQPDPIVRSTSWVDTCCCSDLGYCVAHQLDREGIPTRPSDAEMLERAYARAIRLQPAWEEKMKKFAMVQAFLESEGA